VKAFYNITDWKTTNIQRADSLFTVMREASTEKKQGKKKNQDLRLLERPAEIT